MPMQFKGVLFSENAQILKMQPLICVIDDFHVFLDFQVGDFGGSGIRRVRFLKNVAFYISLLTFMFYFLLSNKKAFTVSFVSWSKVLPNFSIFSIIDGGTVIK